jgi:hypothetical protein
MAASMANFTPILTKEMVTSTLPPSPTPNLKLIRKEKIELLKDFCVPITESIKAQLKELNTEIALDNYCTKLVREFLSDERISDKYFSKIVGRYYGKELLRESTIIHLVGQIGFSQLCRKGYITYVGIKDGRKYYSLAKEV